MTTDPDTRSRPPRLGLLGAVATAAALFLAAPPAAKADEFGIVPGSFVAKTHAPLTTDPADFSGSAGLGQFVAQYRQELLDAPELHGAGAHPDASAAFALNARFDEDRGHDMPVDRVRDVSVDLPAGFVGNAQAVPTCSQQDISGPGSGLTGCRASSQIGFALTRTFDPGAPERNTWWHVPVFNYEPPPGAPAAFTFLVGGLVQGIIVARVRSDGDYGVTATVVDTPRIAPLFDSVLTFWGVPADPAHDIHRRDDATSVFGGTSSAGMLHSYGDPSPSERRPFLINPTSCDSGPLTTGIRARSWQNPGTWVEDSDTAPEPTGCDLLQFGTPAAPVSLTAQPDHSVADTPTGLDVNLSLPYNHDPDGLARPTLRDSVVTLPEGMAVSPSAADGLAACTPGRIGLNSLDPPACPEASKLGSLEIETPLLEKPLKGSIFQAAQDDNPFGSTLAIYLVARGSGVIVKLAGHVEADPNTGRLTTTFSDNPQLPFTDLNLRFKSGPRAPLVNPPTCGTKVVTTEFTPWSHPHSGPPATPTDSFEITSGPNGMPCANTLGQRPFGPDLNAGMVNRQAGSTSPFVLRLTRPDGHQEVDSMEVAPPEGLTAFLKGIPLCSDQNANAGNCPAASKVGTTITGAGPGPQPFFVHGGEVFLTGPYKGAPLGLLVQVPAVAGPFDLGMVDVRAAIHVDPRTAQLRVVSDQIPRILEGIPLRVRDIRVLMDRPNFTVAPTSCDPAEVRARVHGSHGASADVSDRFQVSECTSLGFGPRFSFEARGRRATRPNGHPNLRTTVVPREGDANISRARVTLPRGTFLDQDNLETICTRPQFAARECPDDSLIGHAIAHSPLLDDPLRGPVHLIASDNPLPDIVADLRGIVDIALFGRTTSNRRTNRITNTFDVVPDAAVERFELTLRGGPQGLLVNSRDTCRRPAFRRVNIRVLGQNNATAHQTRMVQANRCARQRANRMERRAKRLKRRATRQARRGNRARAKRLRQRGNRLERRADNVRQRLR